jgi:hypothetical protein
VVGILEKRGNRVYLTDLVQRGGAWPRYLQSARDAAARAGYLEDRAAGDA